jgi:hypothetical protein
MGALILPYAPTLKEMLIELRERVDNGPVTQDIQGIGRDGVHIGYRVKEVREGIFNKEVFLRFEQPIAEVPEEERDLIAFDCFDVFLQEGQGPVEFDVVNNGKTLIMTQEHMPLLLTKRETAKGHIKIDDDLDRIVMETMKPWGGKQ